MLTFNLHIGDWIKSTLHLTDAERGVYLSLLLRYYDTEQPLPSEKSAVYRLACARNADAMQSVDDILREFFDLRAGGWHNKRADEEIAEYRAKSEKAKRSAEKRWSIDRGATDDRQQPDGNTDAMRTHTGGNANHEPLTTNHEPRTINHSPSTEGQEDQEHPVEQTLDLNGQPAPIKAGRQADVDAVFDHWCTKLGHPQAKLTDDRRKLISKALGWGYSVDQLCEAIDGCAMTPHNMGINDRGQRYDGLHIILRSGDQIDRFIGNHKNPPRAGDWNRKIQQGAASVNEFVNGGAQ